MARGVVRLAERQEGKTRMRVKSRVAAAAAVAILGMPGAARAATLPQGPVTAPTVAQAQTEATQLADASTAAARAAADAGTALDAAKITATNAAGAAAAAAAAYAASGTQADKDKADAAALAAQQASAAQAAAQTTFDQKSAAAATAAAAAADAATNASREAASFARKSKGTSTEGTGEITETEPFPDNYLHSDNVSLVAHVRGPFSTTAAGKTCPAFNPTKCPGFSSLNFVHYENLGYDVMVANGTAGLGVWSLKDPAHPKWISQVTLDMIKTIIPDPTALAQFWEGENMTVDSSRKLVFMSRDSGRKGQIVVDLNDPWNPQVIAFNPNWRAIRRRASTTAASCGRSAARSPARPAASRRSP